MQLEITCSIHIYIHIYAKTLHTHKTVVTIWNNCFRIFSVFIIRLRSNFGGGVSSLLSICGRRERGIQNFKSTWSACKYMKSSYQNYCF